MIWSEGCAATLRHYATGAQARQDMAGADNG